MFKRDILKNLSHWSTQEDRKPLVLRGARQVGKTFAVRMFAHQFNHFVELNLDLPSDARFFEKGLPVSEIFQSILFEKNLVDAKGKILLFLDEIQNSPQAISLLRYFRENLPQVHLIAAGSLLEAAVARDQVNFPVGRVQFLYMYPMTFREFLAATEEKAALDALDTVPVPDYAASKLFGLFHRYTLVGGMPEVVKKYTKSRHLPDLVEPHQSLIASFVDDIPKYARSHRQNQVLRHCFETAPYHAGKRIVFHGFGQSNYRSHDIANCFRMLQRAMVSYLVYPTVCREPPVEPNFRKAPRLQFLDTGMVNYIVGLQKTHFEMQDLNSLYRGRIAEHVVTQEVMAMDFRHDHLPRFWVREKAQSSAEVDFVLQRGQELVPMEVKSGKSGTLRSLHQFLEGVSHGNAVRLWAGAVATEDAKTLGGKAFRLLNLPYFLASKTHEYLDWAF